MVSFHVNYLGDLRCEATHLPSGTKIITDAPVDNEGRGESFSPTDLAATALATCLITIFGIVAKRHNINVTGTQASVEKHMAATGPRRIAKIVVRVSVPLPPDHPKRELLERAALSCPVHLSLHPEVQQDISFTWSAPHQA